MLSTLVEALNLINRLLVAIMRLSAAAKLPSHGSSRKSLLQDIANLCGRFPKRVNIETVSILLERVIEQRDDESIWSAVYSLFTQSRSPRVLHDLQQDWA